MPLLAICCVYHHNTHTRLTTLFIYLKYICIQLLSWEEMPSWNPVHIINSSKFFIIPYYATFRTTYQNLFPCFTSVFHFLETPSSNFYLSLYLTPFPLPSLKLHPTRCDDFWNSVDLLMFYSCIKSLKMIRAGFDN